MAHADAARERTPDAAASARPALWMFGLPLAAAALLFGADWVLRADNFPVRHVRFEGEFRRVTQPELEAAVMDQVRGNFFLQDLEAVQARVESLPWVFRASVRRHFPQDLHVRFTEQRLRARWGEDAWLNQAGEAVRIAGAGLPRDLPRLEGPPGTEAAVLERYDGLARILAGAGLDLRRLTLTSRRSWRLELANGMVLVVDREQPELKVERFARVYPGVLARAAGRIRQIDLRYTNGLAVEWAGPAHATDSRSEG